MIRNLKAMGLTLIAIFAMGALVASAAMAQTQGELTSDGSVTLDADEIGGGAENYLKVFEETVSCPGSGYTGHKFNETPHKLIPVPATTVTVKPHYNQATCEAGSGLPATVHVPSTCDFVLHLGNTVAAGEYAVTADVECSSGKIAVTIFAGDSHLVRLCTISIGTQTGLTGATVENGFAGHLVIAGTFHGIHAEVSGACTSGTTTTNTATFTLNALVGGTNSVGGTTSVSLTEA